MLTYRPPFKMFRSETFNFDFNMEIMISSLMNMLTFFFYAMRNRMNSVIGILFLRGYRMRVLTVLN